MQTRRMLAGFFAGVAVCTGGLHGQAAEAAAPAANPYQGITERNVFRLNPPPAPAPPEASKPPTPKVFLTGITTLGGPKRALLKTAPTPGKAGDAGKERSYMLTEGERQDELEVVAIDEKEGVVKVNYAGDVFSVNFKDNAVASTTPAAPSAPGAPPNRALPPGAPAPAFRPAGRGMSPALGAAGRAANAATGAGLGAGALSGASGVGGGVAAAAAPPMSAEEQAVLVELNREAYKSDPTIPPLPPTMLSAGLDAANAEATAANTPSLPGRPGGVPQIPGRPGPF